MPPRSSPYDAVVALESSVIAQGLPRPVNLQTALQIEEAVREEGANPATTAFVEGRPVAGVAQAVLERLALGEPVRKASLRDLSVVAARRETASTTVATAAWIAHRAGIRVVATGGIGGVHRDPQGPSADVSADLTALASLPVCVVCSGPKTVLHLGATRERLETEGVTAVGFGTDTMPAFWSAESGYDVDVRCDTATQVADLVRARDRMRLAAAILVCVPVPDAHAIEERILDTALKEAIAEGERRNLRSGEITPFLLEAVRNRLGDAALTANLALLENNARVASRIALALVPKRPDRA